jgi:hypothetical protein
MMTTASQPPELPVSEVVDVYPEELQHPSPQRHEHKFDLDDAFSVHEDEASASFDFNPDSFMKELELSATIGTEGGAGDVWEPGDGEDDEAQDMQDSTHTTYDSTDASVSTLDIDAVVDLQHTPTTPPQPSSSSHSFNSSEQPSTPPDDSLTSPAELSSQFTNIALSPPLNSSPYPHDHEVDHAYPNVVIDASKTPTNRVTTTSSEFPTSESQQTSDSHDSSSIGSEPAADPGATAPIIGNLHRAAQSTSSNYPTSAQSPSSSSHRPSPSVSAPFVKSRTSGPSTLQKVVSKTRPPYLPPKGKEEDEKHRKEWEAMMQRSRIASMWEMIFNS